MSTSRLNQFSWPVFLETFLSPCRGWNKVLCSGVLAVAVLCPATAWPAPKPAPQELTVKRLPGKIRFEIGGQLFTEYHYEGAPHVYFYPLIGPDGVQMTRHAPMKKVDGEDQDHPHHRALWFSHGSVNGVDFWAETPKAGKIVHDRILELTSNRRQVLLRAAHRWEAPDGKVICTDELLFRVYPREDGQRLLDFEIKLKAPEDQEVVLGDTKEGTMAIRLAETMRLKPNKFNQTLPVGHIFQSTGIRDGDTWGKRAAWCDYYGLAESKTVGVAIFDHPQNPRHPTWWHVRDYGLFAANPFGLHDFEKSPKGTGDMKIAAGSSIEFKYRFFIHRGDTEHANVAAEFNNYAAETKPALRGATSKQR